jgi:hypothetical protein
MRFRSRALLTAVGLTTALLVGAAMASDKAIESQEKNWDPTSGAISLLADVADVEPNGTFATAQVLGCGNTFRPATIGAARDTDYVAFTATAGTLVTIGTDADGTTGQIGDTRIRLFNSAGAVLASDDDSGPGLYSLISNFAITTTGTYYVGFAAFSTTATGAYKGFITCQIPQPPPANDTCAGAIPIDCGVTLSLSGSTTFANNDYTPLLSGTGGCTGFTALGRDVVYSLTVTAGQILNISYTSSADGSVYVISDCASPTTSCVAGADATLGGVPEVLNYAFATAGTYYLILDSFGTNSSGNWTLTGTLSCPVVPVDKVTWSSIKSLYR